MRYIFSLSSRAGAVRIGSIERLLHTRFHAQRKVFLLDPPGRLIDLLCRAYGSEGIRLIAVGGDGTVQRLFAAAVRYDIPIGILPFGTANDLARAIGLNRNPKECCDVIRSDHTRTIDLVAVNGKPFATCGGLGLPSSVAVLHNRFNNKESRVSANGFRKAAYFLDALRALGRSHPVDVRIREGHPGWSGRAMAVVISNQARFGALFSVSPSAVHDDGFFDLCVIPDPESRFRRLLVVVQAALGKETIGAGFEHRRLCRTRILTNRIVPFFGDGEILSRGRDFRIEILPRTVRLLVPEGSWEKEISSHRSPPYLFRSCNRHWNIYGSGKRLLFRLQKKQRQPVGFFGEQHCIKTGLKRFYIKVAALAL